ncbi:hypothetical protein WMY93_001606 [Mugilogobius chulae]|uniref:EF-hand domain-containing protein n=1 Tax=Mugilogobius chulae TaxID=88201 RepID=A0AAW0PTJ4_9GOBI
MSRSSVLSRLTDGAAVGFRLTQLFPGGAATTDDTRVLLSVSVSVPLTARDKHSAFTIIDQNRDGIISKDDLRDVLASMGQLNTKNEELEAMIKEASGPINFTVFLTMFGEKLKGADPEDVILSAFKVLDPEGTEPSRRNSNVSIFTVNGFSYVGFVSSPLNSEFKLLLNVFTSAVLFTVKDLTLSIKNMWAAFPPDVAGNVDYKNICYVITHGEEKEECLLSLSSLRSARSPRRTSFTILKTSYERQRHRERERERGEEEESSDGAERKHNRLLPLSLLSS